MIEGLVRNTDGDFVDKNGTVWTSRKEYFATNVLRFCGCVDFHDMLRYVYDMFLLHVVWKDSCVQEDLSVAFFLSWAVNEGYVEYDTQSRCSRLTKKGEELWQDFQQLGY